MKKNLILAAAFVMVAFVFTGCEKCTTCTYADELIPDTSLCGSGDEVDTFESLQELVGATCTRD